MRPLRPARPGFGQVKSVLHQLACARRSASPRSCTVCRRSRAERPVDKRVRRPIATPFSARRRAQQVWALGASSLNPKPSRHQAQRPAPLQAAPSRVASPRRAKRSRGWALRFDSRAEFAVCSRPCWQRCSQESARCGSGCPSLACGDERRPRSLQEGSERPRLRSPARRSRHTQAERRRQPRRGQAPGPQRRFPPTVDTRTREAMRAKCTQTLAKAPRKAILAEPLRGPRARAAAGAARRRTEAARHGPAKRARGAGERGHGAREAGGRGHLGEYVREDGRLRAAQEVERHEDLDLGGGALGSWRIGARFPRPAHFRQRGDCSGKVGCKVGQVDRNNSGGGGL